MIEKLVRPAESADKGYGKLFVRTVTDVPTEPSESSILSWSAQTSVQTTDVKGYKLTIKIKANHVETNRQTITVRVSNPDDPTQYVDVERIEKITFRDGSSNEDIYEFNNSKVGT